MAQNDEDTRAHASILREAIERFPDLPHDALDSSLVTTDFEGFVRDLQLNARRRNTQLSALSRSVSTVMLYARHLLHARHAASLHQGTPLELPLTKLAGYISRMLETTKLLFVYTEALNQRRDGEITLGLRAHGRYIFRDFEGAESVFIPGRPLTGLAFQAGIAWAAGDAVAAYVLPAEFTLEFSAGTFAAERWSRSSLAPSEYSRTPIEVFTYDTLAGELASSTGSFEMSEIPTRYLTPALGGLSPDEHDAQTNIKESAIQCMAFVSGFVNSHRLADGTWLRSGDCRPEFGVDYASLQRRLLRRLSQGILPDNQLNSDAPPQQPLPLVPQSLTQPAGSTRPVSVVSPPEAQEPAPGHPPSLNTDSVSLIRARVTRASHSRRRITIAQNRTRRDGNDLASHNTCSTLSVVPSVEIDRDATVSMTGRARKKHQSRTEAVRGPGDSARKGNVTKEAVYHAWGNLRTLMQILILPSRVEEFEYWMKAKKSTVSKVELLTEQLSIISHGNEKTQGMLETARVRELALAMVHAKFPTFEYSHPIEILPLLLVSNTR
ncbi:hypothetical protein LTR27_007903 [Elasticomyces elasticus]|nr:hypothetical protein LTR27_007903 [Elasticomyces elasticus]